MICISLTSGEPYNLDIATSITQPYHIQLSITSGNIVDDAGLLEVRLMCYEYSCGDSASCSQLFQ